MFSMFETLVSPLIISDFMISDFHRVSLCVCVCIYIYLYTYAETDFELKIVDHPHLFKFSLSSLH